MQNLKEALYYDESTGDFTWIESNGRSPKNSKAGTVGNHGYIQIQYKGQIFLAHRLAWFYMYNAWPKIVDHINGIKIDNSKLNLRSVSPSDNNKNRSVRIDNYTGFKGVTRCRDKYQARITLNGIKQHLGTYKTIAEASQAYEKAAAEYFGEHAYQEKTR